MNGCKTGNDRKKQPRRAAGNLRQKIARGIARISCGRLNQFYAVTPLFAFDYHFTLIGISKISLAAECPLLNLEPGKMIKEIAVLK